MKIKFLEAEVEKLRKQLDHEKSKSSKYIHMLHRVASYMEMYLTTILFDNMQTQTKTSK